MPDCLSARLANKIFRADRLDKVRFMAAFVVSHSTQGCRSGGKNWSPSAARVITASAA